MRRAIAVLLILLIATTASASDLTDLFTPDEWGTGVFVLGSEIAGDFRMTIASKRIAHYQGTDGFLSLLNPTEPERGVGLDVGSHDGDLRGGLGYVNKQHWGVFVRTRW